MAGVQQTLQDFLVNSQAQINLASFILALIISVILAFILTRLYIHYGTALSNRRSFARTFYLIIPTTTLIITIVKSSLALSLGLVGALSIVRFRAAIKEPEELAFLFLCIALGLGLGANQTGVTVIAFALISLVIAARYRYHKKDEEQNLYITVSGKHSKDLTLRKITEILKKHCAMVHLKRFDKTSDDILEAAFLIDLESFEKLEKVKEELSALSKSVSVSYIDKISIYH